MYQKNNATHSGKKYEDHIAVPTFYFKAFSWNMRWQFFSYTKILVTIAINAKRELNSHFKQLRVSLFFNGGRGEKESKLRGGTILFKWIFFWSSKWNFLIKVVLKNIMVCNRTKKLSFAQVLFLLKSTLSFNRHFAWADVSFKSTLKVKSTFSLGRH